MVLFPNAKINLGLFITARRSDGYHEISTVMVPVGWCDILEITPAKGPQTTLKTFGRHVDCPPEKNLVMKAYNALSAFTGGLPPVDFCLEKVIPDGAGLGGGSADAGFALRGLNTLFNIGLPENELAKIALQVGADCPFFIYNRPALCEGIGEKISFDVSPALNGKVVVIAKPRVAAVSTREAYAGVTPRLSDIDLRAAVARHPGEWNRDIRNDFEESIFPLLPQVANAKDTLVSSGAVYAAMSGSGAAVFGIFDDDKMAYSAADSLTDCDTFVTSSVI